MPRFRGLEAPLECNWEGLVANLRRVGTPDRVYHIELFHDAEVRDAIAERFGLVRGVTPSDPHYEKRKLVAVNRFCGFDYIVTGLAGFDFPTRQTAVEDSAALKRAGGRSFQDEHTGPISTWEDFEKYPWPDPTAAGATQDLEWYEKNLPEDMCIIGGLASHFAELLSWLMGYETLCFALYEQRDLVTAVARRLEELYGVWMKRVLEFPRVRIVWGSDDMGYKTGLLVGPRDMREFVLPGHKKAAATAHAAGRLYILHSCGNLSAILPDLVDDVRIDGKHSFEDTIEDVRDAKRTYGRKVALLGGIDVDFLCRADEDAIRRRVRETLDVCLPGGGYCLGTGNTVANYIPLDHYLAMVDEGRLYGA